MPEEIKQYPKAVKALGKGVVIICNNAAEEEQVLTEGGIRAPEPEKAPGPPPFPEYPKAVNPYGKQLKKDESAVIVQNKEEEKQVLKDGRIAGIPPEPEPEPEPEPWPEYPKAVKTPQDIPVVAKDEAHEETLTGKPRKRGRPPKTDKKKS